MLSWLVLVFSLVMQETYETRVRSLGQKDPLEKRMATHSSILAWAISWTEEPARLQSMDSENETGLSIAQLLLSQSCPTLCGPLDYSLPGSSVHGLLQARTLEWVAISFSRGSFWPRDPTCISYVSCIGQWDFTTSATWEAKNSL